MPLAARSAAAQTPAARSPSIAAVSSPDPPPPAAEPAPRKNRSLRRAGHAVVLLVLLSAPLAWLFGGALVDDDGTTETILLMATGSAALLAAALWVLFLSGWRAAWKAAALGGAAAFLVGLFTLYKPTVDGAMKITGFRPRFGETAEDRAVAFAAKNTVEPAAAATDAPAPPLIAGPRDWPGLLGPNRDGIVPDARVRTDWAAELPAVQWRHPVGPGWGGFAVVGDAAFTLEQRGEEETVVCYRVADGAELWSHGEPVRFGRIAANGGDGPASTPYFADGRVYSMGATGVVTCLDVATGGLVWKRELLPPDANIEWGLACSPLIAGGNLVVLPGVAAGPESAAMGLDPETGETVWASGDSPASYCSPVVADLGGERRILAFEGEGLRGLSLDGNTRWSIPWTNGAGVNAAVPIASGDRVFLSSGYGTGAAVYDVSGAKPEEVWFNGRFKLKFNDAILHRGHLYGLSEGILSCVDFGTGDQLWKAGRYGYGQCLLLGTAGGGDPVLLVSCEDGDLALVRPSPDRFEELGTWSAAAGSTLLSGTCWNHAALADGRLLWRNGTEAVCVRLGAAAADR